MLAIRLRRTGSKKRPFFRVVVTDSRTARDSSFVEVLGFYNPRTNPETLKLNRERLDHWVKAGAVAVRHGPHAGDRMPEMPETAAVGSTTAAAAADSPRRRQNSRHREPRPRRRRGRRAAWPTSPTRSA